MVSCVPSHGVSPHPPEPPKGPPALMHTYKHTTLTPMRPPASHRRQPRYPYSTPWAHFAPCPLFPPPPICTFLKTCRAFFPFNLPPPKRERDIQQVQLRGGGRGTRADTSLFPVSADRLKGSNILKMSSVKSAWAHGQPPLTRASVAEHMRVHKAIGKHVPSRGTNGIIVGRHNYGPRKHTCSQASLLQERFPIVLPENRQVIGNAIKRAHREPRYHQLSKAGNAPPTAQRGRGGGGDTQGQSTLMLIGKFVWKKAAASPNLYNC